MLEQLISGPGISDAYPTVNPNTKINSVTVTDAVCYVNLSSDFLENTYEVVPEVALYSIVNSLVELNHISKVQISVEGSTNIIYYDTFNLETMYVRNLDIIAEE